MGFLLFYIISAVCSLLVMARFLYSVSRRWTYGDATVVLLLCLLPIVNAAVVLYSVVWRVTTLEIWDTPIFKEPR